MITLILLILAIVVGVLYFKAKYQQIKQADTWVEAPGFWKAVVTLIVGIIVAFAQPFTLERVDAGTVGIKVNLTGDNRGVGKYEYKTGWVVVNTWTSKLYEFPTYQQHIDYDAQQIISKGGFAATIKPSFNYSLKTGEVGDMFSNLRKDIKSIEREWLNTAIVGAINDVANKWAVDDIFNQREKFEGDIVTEANKRVQKWFTISQLRTNITPPEALQKSIEAKTKAIQEVQVAENQRLVAIAEGDRKIAEARADSASQVIKAAGEANAIKLKQEQITPTYVEYTKWAGAAADVDRVPSTVLGGNTPYIFSPK